jgi:dihydrodipicolinate synthase/N-acetylneuraminate lyase
MPNAALKFWSEYMNLAGGTVRPPLKQLSEEQKHQLKNDLDSLCWA